MTRSMFVIHLAVCFVIALSTTVGIADEPDKPLVMVEMRIIQLAGPQATADSVWTTAPAGLKDSKKAVEPKVLATMDNGLSVGVAPANVALRLGGQVWLPAAESSDTPSSTSIWKTLTAPRLLCCVGQEANISIGQRVAYMVPRADGAFTLEHTEEAEGIAIDVLPEAANDKIVSLKKVRMRITRVVSRQPVAGLPFEVGRPVLHTVEASTALRLATDQVAVFTLPQAADDDQPIFALLQARWIEPEPDTED
ncbi:MAG: hypothetical protein ABIG44_00680 [Planctomycetota bacterium]